MVEFRGFPNFFKFFSFLQKVIRAFERFSFFQFQFSAVSFTMSQHFSIFSRLGIHCVEVFFPMRCQVFFQCGHHFSQLEQVFSNH